MFGLLMNLWIAYCLFQVLLALSPIIVLPLAGLYFKLFGPSAQELAHRLEMKNQTSKASQDYFS